MTRGGKSDLHAKSIVLTLRMPRRYARENFTSGRRRRPISSSMLKVPTMSTLTFFLCLITLTNQGLLITKCFEMCQKCLRWFDHFGTALKNSLEYLFGCLKELWSS